MCSNPAFILVTVAILNVSDQHLIVNEYSKLWPNVFNKLQLHFYRNNTIINSIALLE